MPLSAKSITTIMEIIKKYRENNPAIVIENFSSYGVYNLFSKPTFYLFGKEYENKAEFDKAKEKLLMQDKIGNF